MHKFNLTNITSLFRTAPLRNFFRSTVNMDDELLESQEILKSFIDGGGSNKDEAVVEYLKTVKYPPIKDFKEGLEWFNVSEPLSFGKHLKGKIVLLDFFTYCCINCMHILPDLKELENEFSVEDGLVVIGVHSAKFDNEKISKNVLSSVQRYNIIHPVVNDNTLDMWQKCNVHCWPTLVLLGPKANPLVMFLGEGHKNRLKLCIKNALAYYKSKDEISSHSLPHKSAHHLLPKERGPLLFPGKITNFIDEDKNEIIAVSDSGNHRIIVFTVDGTVMKQFGSSKPGFRDGKVNEARFNSPQGLVFQSKDVLFVADTENHAIRKINLKNDTVETVAGTGAQGHDHEGGKKGTQQIISSPWDLSLYRTPDSKEVLLIAMAGTHQIWALFLDETGWWKSKKYPAGTCVAIAGSGREENRNNQYPHAAGFAQPSGLALSNKKGEVYIADSESSSVRRLSLVDGKVTAVVGGHKNPQFKYILRRSGSTFKTVQLPEVITVINAAATIMTPLYSVPTLTLNNGTICPVFGLGTWQNLFAFGDKDGVLYEAKLQHLLGLAMSEDGNTLFVADTYNHKIKKVDVSRSSVSTMKILEDATDGDYTSFNEPGGLCFSGNKLLLADTNNHRIKILELDEAADIKRVRNVELKITENISRSPPPLDLSKYKVLNSKVIQFSSKGATLNLEIELFFVNGLKLTEDVLQKWSVHLPSEMWACAPGSGNDINNVNLIIKTPTVAQDENATLDVLFSLITCTDEHCYPKNFLIRQPIQLTANGDESSHTIINVNISADKTELL